MLAADFTPLRFSTRRLPEQRRLSTWREEFGRRLLRVDIEPLADTPYHAEGALRALPGLRSLSASFSAAHYRRTPALVADGDDSVSIIVSSGCTVSQRGRDAVLGSGDGAAMLTQEPTNVTFKSAGSVMSVFVPHAAVASRMADVYDKAMQVIPRRSEALRLLVGYLKLLRENSVHASPKLRDAVVAHVHDLVALALTERAPLGETSLDAVGAARLAMALDYIGAHACEPQLSLAAVAKSQGISPRYLQRLLEGAGTSLTALVNELRLQRAFGLLTGPQHSTRRISDIALESGFSDLSQFNRLFRSRFGETPRAMRAHAHHE